MKRWRNPNRGLVVYHYRKHLLTNAYFDSAAMKLHFVDRLSQLRIELLSKSHHEKAYNAFYLSIKKRKENDRYFYEIIYKYFKYFILKYIYIKNLKNDLHVSLFLKICHPQNDI